jgi:hypothetical protein
MRSLLFATMALATLGVATASFAGGPTGGTGTPDSSVMTDGSPGNSGTSDGSSNAMWGYRSASASDGSSGITVLPPSGGKGGYPARLSNSCPAPGTPQDTGASTGRSC